MRLEQAENPASLRYTQFEEFIIYAFHRKYKSKKEVCARRTAKDRWNFGFLIEKNAFMAYNGKHKKRRFLKSSAKRGGAS